MLKAQVTIFLQPSFRSQAFASLTLRPEVNLIAALPGTCFFFFFYAARLWDFSSLTRDRTWGLRVRVQNPNHWTAKEFPPGTSCCF